MVDYKVRNYTGKNMNYTPTNPAAKQDTRIKFYKPSQPIRDLPPVRTYDTKPRRYLTTRTYDKVKTYDSYTEYVPPWSRGKVKVKSTPGQPDPEKKEGKKEKKKEKKEKKYKVEPQKVTFAPVPRAVQSEKSLQAVGSVKRMLMLFQ